MADEILSGSGGGENLVVAQVISRMVQLQLADRASLRNHPAIVNMNPGLIGATVEKVSIVGLDGVDQMTSRTEIQSEANTAFTSSAATVTPAPFRLAYEMSDLMQAIDPNGIANPLRFARSIAVSASMTLTNLIAQGIDGFTQVGSTGVAMTHDTFLAAQFALKQALVTPPFLFVAKPKAFTDWQDDLEARGGNTQWRAATTQMMALNGQGAEGSYNNIEVFTSDQVQSINGATVDWASSMFGRGAVGYKELRMAPPPRSQFVILDIEGVIRIAELRAERTGETAVVGHYNVGTINIEAGRGRTIVSGQ